MAQIKAIIIKEQDIKVYLDRRGVPGIDGTSGSSGTGLSGTSGTSSVSTSGTSGTSGTSSTSGTSGTSSTSGTSGESIIGDAGSSGTSGTSSTSGTSGSSAVSTSGTSGTSGISIKGDPGGDGSSGTSGTSPVSTSGTSGTSGNGTSGTSDSGTSGTSSTSGSSGTSSTSGTSGWGTSGTSSTSGSSGISIQGDPGTSGTSGEGSSGTSGTSSSGGGGGLNLQQIIVIDPINPEVVGKSYQSVANAYAYLASISGYGPNVCTGGTASASNENAPNVAALAFDGDTGTYWDASQTYPIIIKYALSVAKTVAKYSVFFTNAYIANDWTFEGSNNNADWDVLDTVTGYATSGGTCIRDVTNFTNTEAYLYYRLNITACHTGGLDVSEIQMMEFSGGPSSDNIWGILISGTWAEDIVLTPWIFIYGIQGQTVLTGKFSLTDGRMDYSLQCFNVQINNLYNDSAKTTQCFFWNCALYGTTLAAVTPCPYISMNGGYVQSGDYTYCYLSIVNGTTNGGTFGDAIMASYSIINGTFVGGNFSACNFYGTMNFPAAALPYGDPPIYEFDLCQLYTEINMANSASILFKESMFGSFIITINAGNTLETYNLLLTDGATVNVNGGTWINHGPNDGTSGTSGTSSTSGTSGLGTSGTSGTSSLSTSGTSGSSGFGTSGTSSTSGTSGTSSTSGTSGTSSTGAGSSGTSGTSGSSGFGTSGTSSTSGTSGSTGVYLGAGTLAVSGTSGTFDLDFSQSNGFYGTANLSGMVVVFQNPTDGQVYRFMIRQGTAGTATITNWAQMDGTNGIWLGGGTAGTLSTAAGKRDVVTVWYVNSLYMASYLNG